MLLALMRCCGRYAPHISANLMHLVVVYLSASITTVRTLIKSRTGGGDEKCSSMTITHEVDLFPLSPFPRRSSRLFIPQVVAAPQCELPADAPGADEPIDSTGASDAATRRDAVVAAAQAVAEGDLLPASVIAATPVCFAVERRRLRRKSGV